MPHLSSHAMQQKEAAIHDSTFFFVGPFDADDSSLLRGSRPTRPTPMSLGRPAASPLSSSCSDDCFFDDDDCYEDDDCAVLGDDDAPSEDELPRSPRRRHSGAMSISEEDLPFCYDRAALRRDTDAHRARHAHHLPQQWQQPQQHPQQQPHHLQQRQQKQLVSSCPTEHHTGASHHAAATFAAHDKWDAETDGPHMALWVPDSGAAARGEAKRRRVEQQSRAAAAAAARSVGAAAPGVSARAQHHSSEMQGPMMALWGV